MIRVGRRWLRAAVVGAATVLLLNGCGTVRETLPGRAAMEQFLISTAADRAVAGLPGDAFHDKAVFLDVTNLDCFDRPYVVQRLRTTLRAAGARLVESRDAADLVLETASGGLSINKQDMLFGLPAIPLPIPYVSETLKFPELPLLKSITHRGRAKLLFSLLDARTNRELMPMPVCYGGARETYWWVLIVGPMRSSDLPEEAR